MSWQIQAKASSNEYTTSGRASSRKNEIMVLGGSDETIAVNQ